LDAKVLKCGKLEKMVIFWILGFVGAADWEVSCNADSIKVLIDPNLLEQQTGSRDHRLGPSFYIYLNFTFS